jgi:hypothetical protein
MNLLQQYIQMLGFLSFVFFAVVLAVAFFCFSFNYELVKSRGRKDEMFLWMLLTLLFWWIVTLVLLAMKPVLVEDEEEALLYRRKPVMKKSS